MTWSLMKAIIILPGTVLVFVPTAILIVSRGTRFYPDLQYPTEVTFFLAMAIVSTGGYLAVRTATLFTKSGDGTPAPWEPPKKLVITGPYRYVRNPMISGAILILLGETVLFNSWPLFLWTIVFLAGKMLYLPFIEEKELKQRFGEPYLEYMAHVPRWIPRFRVWNC
ncbi:MAG: isoprenylcysteine carboxylmethyltransferase family protein [Desulfobacteraceae bacterium]|nr:isoprenylcysteine carboxylmethyltransferase family protein [Desulfobacteraceae bacterium]